MAKKQQGSSTKGFPYTSDIIRISIELGLPPNERHILHLLRSYINEKQIQKAAWPSQIKLAEQMGISDRQVRRLIKKLEFRNIISIAKKIKTRNKYGNKVNEYRFIFPWKTITPDESARTSVSGIKPDISDTSDRTSETVKPDIGDSKTGHGRPPIKSKNKSENKPSSLSQGMQDDEVSFLDLNRKKQPAQELTFVTAGDIGRQLDNFVVPPELPAPLKRYYSSKSKSIEKVDLTQSAGPGERYDLLRYVSPFTGRRNELMKNYGNDYSDPMPGWWEKQFKGFYKTVIAQHWQEGSKPNAGFKTTMRRACVSGIMQNYGFIPKTPQQIRVEKQEAERFAREEQEREKEMQRMELAEKMEKERKERNLFNIYQDLVKDDLFLEECMTQCHYISWKTGKLNREAFKALIEELYKTGKVKKKGRKTLIAKLREAILKQAGV